MTENNSPFQTGAAPPVSARLPQRRAPLISIPRLAPARRVFSPPADSSLNRVPATARANDSAPVHQGDQTDRLSTALRAGVEHIGEQAGEHKLWREVADSSRVVIGKFPY